MKHIELIQDLLYNIKQGKQKITRHYQIPLSQIKLETNEWKSVDNVACVFVDLENSTKIAMGNIQQAMQIFSTYGDSLVRIFDFYGTHYIDIQGDGGFALFDGVSSIANAYSTAISINSLFNIALKLNIRIGIDVGTIYVKKVGIRGENKEVWLGSPVNIASKLCNLKISNIGAIRVSSVFFNAIPQQDKKYFKHYSPNLSNIKDFYYSGLYWQGVKI